MIEEKDYMKKAITRSHYESDMEHEKWRQVIPFIQFPPEWNIQVCPPFSGAVIRFRVNKDIAHVSVYLDCYDILGIFGEPYWEIYPAADNDTFRCEMKDIAALLGAIQESIDAQIRGEIK